MIVHKFGGASVNSSEAVKNVAKIAGSLNRNEGLILIFSAMGKTTNALEQLTEAFFDQSGSVLQILDQIKDYHLEICGDLFPKKDPFNSQLHKLFSDLEELINTDLKSSRDFDYVYDQIVSYGEILSTQIIHHYLENQGIQNTWIDIRKILLANKPHRDAGIDWDKSLGLFNTMIKPITGINEICITQGFIAGNGNTSFTLGREGSDYSAAIMAFLGDAGKMFIWKDVPGLLNADPKYFTNTRKLDKISYHEAIELAYYGASVLHPKTIKPLQNKNIPLYVKSFHQPAEKGSLITNDSSEDTRIPSYIFKREQILLSISPKDFSFITEKHLGDIFNLTASFGFKVNLMQNSAISFSLCIDKLKEEIWEAFMDTLSKTFNVRFNTDLELITIRHYDQKTIDEVAGNRDIILEQKSRNTVQIILKSTREAAKKSSYIKINSG